METAGTAPLLDSTSITATYLNGGNLTMAGTSSWGGGTIYIDNGSTLSSASGTFTATTNDSIFRFNSGGIGTAAFSNAGAFV